MNSKYVGFLTVHCKWNDWGACSKSCGTGVRSRTVEIEPKHGGNSCDGPTIESCNSGPCPGKIISIDT